MNKITNLQSKKTKTGNEYLSFQYGDKKLNYFDNANFWIIENAFKEQLDIEIGVQPNGKYWNITSVAGATAPAGKGTSTIAKAVAQKKEDIVQFVKEKNETIKEFSEQKNENIKKFAAMRDASLFAASTKSREELTLDLEYWTTVFKEKYGVEYDPSECKF